MRTQPTIGLGFANLAVAYLAFMNSPYLFLAQQQVDV